MKRTTWTLAASWAVLTLSFGLADPLQAAEYDLTSPGATATINGAIYQQGDIQPAGTGVFGTFLRVQSHGSKNTVESGFNTDYRPAPLDDKSDIHTHSLLLSQVGTVTIGGTLYRQFALDINEPQNGGTNPLLSLDKLQLYLANQPDIATLSDLQNQTKIYDLGDNSVKLQSSLSHGSGQSDMFLNVPDSLFTGGQYVYLYSEFGIPDGSNGGFEEWASREAEEQPPTNELPAPATLVLAALGCGLGGAGYLRRCFRRKGASA